MAKNIERKFKKLITALLAFLVKGLELALVGAFKGMLLAGKFLAPVGRRLFRYFFLPLYGYHLTVRRRVAEKARNRLEAVILAIANKYTIYFVVSIIAFGVISSNLQAASRGDNYGQSALVYKVIGLDNSEYVEDKAEQSRDYKVYSYQGDGNQVQASLYTEAQRQEEESYYAQNTSALAMGTDSGSLSKPDIIDTSDAKAGSKAVRDYVVAEGDTISRIAAKFGVSVNTILWANNLAATSYIRSGQQLKIPPTSGVLHTVVRGDTLSKLAQTYDASADTIAAYNNIDEKGLIIGQTVMVPGGRVIYTAKPRTAVASSGNTGTQTYKPTGSIASTGKMMWPSACQRISQYYRGWLHTGVDIACPSGTWLKAADSGVVTRVQYGRTGYGYNVMIDHGGGTQTLYAHMSRIDVKVGQTVAKGQQIGLEGSTGRSTGPHLHFEVRRNGATVNPLGYIR